MGNLKIGVIGLPGKWSTEVLADAMKAKTGFRLIIDMAEVAWDSQKRQLRYREYDLCQFDALMVKKISDQYSPNTLDRLELLRIAEQAGVRVFSPAGNILRLINRLSCTVSMQNAGIPMPETCVTENIALAAETVANYGRAILKPLYSTKARGMTVLHKDMGEQVIVSELRSFKQNNPMIYLQKMRNIGGRDLGLLFLGGRYFGCYARISQNETWNTTIHNGGKYAAYQPSKDIIALAYKAQALFAMDYTTVDVAITEEGPVIFEVSAFGGFRGALQGAGVNMAEQYAAYAIAELQGNTEEMQHA